MLAGWEEETGEPLKFGHPFLKENTDIRRAFQASALSVHAYLLLFHDPFLPCYFPFRSRQFPCGGGKVLSPFLLLNINADGKGLRRSLNGKSTGMTRAEA
jgi:hypothetical protein